MYLEARAIHQELLGSTIEDLCRESSQIALLLTAEYHSHVKSNQIEPKLINSGYCKRPCKVSKDTMKSLGF